MDLCVTFKSVYQAQSSSGVLLLSGKQRHQSSQPLHGEGGGGRAISCYRDDERVCGLPFHTNIASPHEVVQYAGTVIGWYEYNSP